MFYYSIFIFLQKKSAWLVSFISSFLFSKARSIPRVDLEGKRRNDQNDVFSSFFPSKTSPLLLLFFSTAMSSQLGNPQCCFCPRILTKRRRVDKDYDGPIRAPSGHFGVQMSCPKCLTFMQEWMTVSSRNNTSHPKRMLVKKEAGRKIFLAKEC